MPFSFLVICLFVAVLGLPCCVWALSGCSEWRVVPGCARPAHALVPLEEHRLWAPGLRQLQRPWAQLSGSKWIRPMSPALAGRLLTAGPPGVQDAVSEGRSS